eukprot:1973959-Prymnesium_polylepis.2
MRVRVTWRAASCAARRWATSTLADGLRLGSRRRTSRRRTTPISAWPLHRLSCSMHRSITRAS